LQLRALIAGQPAELHAEPLDRETAETRSRDSLHFTNQRKRKIGKITIRFGDKEIDMRGNNRILLKNSALHGKPALTDIDESTGVVAKKGERLVFCLIPLVASAFSATRTDRMHIHSLMNKRFNRLASCGFLKFQAETAEGSSIVGNLAGNVGRQGALPALNFRQYSQTSRHRWDTFNRK
jgi:hypothetical protein